MDTKTEKILEILKDSTYRQILGTISTLQGLVDNKLKSMKPLQDS